MTTAFDWKARTGDVWAAEWRRTDRSFAGLSRHLDAAIRAAAPETGRALDIGCGAGGTSLTLAGARPALAITGIDLSEGLIAVARQRAAGCPNLRFHVADAADPSPEAPPCDLLYSRHGVMFFADPVAGFAALRARAAPGARLIFSCFRPRAENPWALTVDDAVGNDPPQPSLYAPGPYGLADQSFTAEVLERAGWRDASASPIDFTYVAGADDDPAGDALDFFSRIGSAARTLADAPPDRRAAMRDRLRAALGAHVTGGVVTFPAAAWIWSASAGEERS